ncbi:WD40 repeat domain-containing protein [Nonomuraea fuscirosea]|uniref:WD40 repeat domain-containing protein n=1 Tax=Nonomuraea fuscirosea TaxID=1291556 RepID=UPI0034228292
MASFSLIRSSVNPWERSIWDFDVVQAGGRPLVVCASCSDPVFTWDPLEDRWDSFRLDMPFQPEDRHDFIDVYAIGAVVLDGRIAVGGGSDHQPFAQWDLETGAVEISADTTHAALGKAIGIEMDGRPMLVGADQSTSPRVRVYDVQRREMYAELLGAHFDGIGALASGTLGERPVLLSSSWDGSVEVWDLREKRSLVQSAKTGPSLMGATLVPVNGRPRIVGAENDAVWLVDPETGEGDEALPWPAGITEQIEEGEFEDEFTCIDAGLVGGRPVAVTGSEEGRVCAWDLEEGRTIGEPLIEHDGKVSAVRLTDLGGRTVAITAGRDGQVNLWDLQIPQIAAVPSHSR